MDLKQQIKERFKNSDESLQPKRTFWTEYENLFQGKLADQISGQNAKSQVFDHKLSTLTMDRSARVMAQLPMGKVRGISKNDEGGERLMNLTLDKYIIPNANAQFDFLTKCRMVDLYSNIYGNFFVMVDWDVKSNGYIGPDMWLIPMRDVFPQVGACSVEDSDFIIIRTWKPLSFFENLKGKPGYKNIDKIITKLKETSGSKNLRSQNEQSSREYNAYPTTSVRKGDGYYQILSQYEKDRWVDVCTDADYTVFRDRKNPQDNKELPVVNKFSIPLLDDFMGTGDFERGKTMQYTINSLWNLYLDGIRVSIFPPVLLDKDKIADSSSIKWAAAAKWLMKMGGAQTGAQVLNLSPQGTNTFNNVYQVVTSSLLNMMGTTETSTSQGTDPAYGKTPEALKLQTRRENARDTVDRFYMEQFLTKVNRKFINLISKKQSKQLQIRMFGPEIDEIAEEYPEIKEMFDDKSGKLRVPKGKIGSIIYDYEIVSGSTYAADNQQQQQNLLSLLNTVLQGLQMGPQGLTSPLITALEEEGKELKIGELFTRTVANSGILDWDKIIVDKGKNPQATLDKHSQILQQAIQASLSQNGQQNINGIPVQPPIEQMQEIQQPMQEGINNGQFGS